MGIFSLLFRKNTVITEDESFDIETIETVSSKIEVVYHSGMRFKSLDSYTPNVDIMEIVVPIAIDIFKDDYTVYFTEKLLSSTLNKLNLNLSLRKEIRLLSIGETTSLEAFKSMSYNEISYLDISFLEKISNNEIDIPTYIKVRQVLLESFKKAGETDPYFNEMHTVFSSRFLEYSDVSKHSHEISSHECSADKGLENVSNVLYIDNPNSATPSRDIMHIANEKLASSLSSIYNYDFVSVVLSKTINFLHKSVQEKLSAYDESVSSIDYLSEIKKAIEEVDLNLIDMIRYKKIDETTYFTIQEVLIESFLEAKQNDLYMESISTILNNHIDENRFFKEYISLKLHDIFGK